MEKRYQVFVSSTFVDLIDERRAVMQGLLELDCFPAGMELFPASDDDAWTLIQRVIDDCDYYLVILAGRYGSTDANGVSYTEKEYDYAVSRGKPVLGFLRADPDSIPVRHTDRDPELQRRLEAFRAKVQDKLCKFWRNADDLGAAITTSYARLIKTHPADGWVQAKYIKTTEDAEKVTRLIEQVRTLEKELEALRRLGVTETSGLAQGEDPVRLEFAAGGRPNVSVDATWNEVFATVGKACLGFPDDDKVASLMGAHWKQPDNAKATPKCVDMVKTQFFCLGLIRISSRVRQMFSPIHPELSPEYVEHLWELTDYGRIKLGELIAAKHRSA